MKPIQPLQLLFILLIMTLLGLTKAQAQCNTVPGTARATGNVNFGNNLNWANPNAIDNSDNTYARAKIGYGEVTKYLHAHDFGFSIPAGATITGIVVTVERRQDLISEISDNSVMLVKNGVRVGNDYAISNVVWPVLDLVQPYGSPLDLWGTTWTPADINDPDFGFMISAHRLGGSLGLPSDYHAFIDEINVQVFYFDPSCLLGIEMAEFTASATNESIDLEWVTLSETNNDRFEVEKSSDGENFELMTTLSGAGNSNAPLSYAVTDASPREGYNYYRIRQVDFDGQTSVSATRQAYFSGQGPAEMLAYPNPVQKQVSIDLGTYEGVARVEVYDLSGTRHLTESVEVVQGLPHALNLSGLPTGTYLLRATGTHLNASKMILKN